MESDKRQRERERESGRERESSEREREERIYNLHIFNDSARVNCGGRISIHTPGESEE